MHEPLGQRRDHERPHVHGAGGLAHDADVAGVAPEGPGVGLHEPQGLDLVEQAEVAGVVLRVAGLEARVVQPPEEAQAVVHRDDHGLCPAGQLPPVVHGVRRVADHVAAAVHEHHHREVASLGGRTEHVEGQAVLLAHRRPQALADVEVVVRAVGRRGEEATGLDAARAVLLGAAHGPPGLVRHRRPPAQPAHRRFGVRDPQPGVGAGRPGPVDAVHRAEGGVPDDAAGGAIGRRAGSGGGHGDHRKGECRAGEKCDRKAGCPSPHSRAPSGSRDRVAAFASSRSTVRLNSGSNSTPTTEKATKLT